MSQSRDHLIATLAANAAPVARPGRVFHLAIPWVLGAMVIVIALMAWRRPFSVSRLAAVTTAPRFALELMSGIAAIVALTATAYRSAIPSMSSLMRQLIVPFGCLLIWIGLVAYSLFDPALAPDMHGKRAHCWLEVLVSGLPGLACGVWLSRRLWPLRGRLTGVLLGLASGAIPALLMQVICVYEPSHGLLFHLLPGLLLGGVGALLGAWKIHPR